MIRRRDRIIHLGQCTIRTVIYGEKERWTASGTHYVSRSGRPMIYADRANCRLSFVSETSPIKSRAASSIVI